MAMIPEGGGFGRNLGNIGSGLGSVGGVGQGAKAAGLRPVGSAVQKRYKSSIASNNSGRYSAPAAPPAAGPGPIPSIDDFLNGDSGYQQQLREFGNNLTQFLADVTRRRGTTETDYGVSKKALDDQRVQDLDNLEQDYGSRGVLRSGLYGKAVGDYETEFGNRQSDLTRREQDALAQLTQEQGKYTSQQDLQKQNAREDAIRRRASQYGV